MPANLLGIDNTNVYAELALKRLQAEAPLFDAFTTDFSNEGDGANIVVPIFTSTYTLNNTDTNGITAQSSTSSIATVTYGTRDITLDFSETKWANMSARTIGESLIPDMTVACANLVAKDVFSGLTYAAIGSGSVIASAAFSSSAAYDQSTALSTAKCPASGRSMVLTPAYYGSLVKSAGNSFTSVAERSTNSYRIGYGFGFQNIIEWADLPTNSENLVGVALHKSGVAFAMRKPTAPTGIGAVVGEAADPTSKFAVQVRNWWNQGKFYLGIFMSYGYTIGNAGAVKAIRSA